MKLIKLLTSLFLISLLLFNCSSRHLQMDMPDRNIPEKAETAIVISALNADSMFSVVKDSLIHDGYLLDQKNEQLYALTTQSQNIGKNKQMRMSFLIEQLENSSSRMTVRAEWRSIPEIEELGDDQDPEDLQMIGWKGAAWTEPLASRRAFAYMVKFINKIPNENLSFN